jgi:hypothetical protein
MGEEKREYSRIEVSWPISMSTTDGVVDGELKDISLGGALIRCRRLPMEDESFDLMIEIPEYAFPVSAVVEKVRLHSQDSDAASQSYELALRFTDISEDDFKLLCNAVECEARLRSRRPTAKTSVPGRVKGDVIRSMEKLSRELRRPFADLLQEAMEDFIKKHEKESSEE